MSFRSFLKDHKLATVLIVVLIFLFIVGVPLCISLIARTPGVAELFVPSWSATDALSYYGSVLGFLSTTILSGLALWQNHVIRVANDKHTALLEHMEQIKFAPCLKITSCCCSGNASNLEISVINISEGYAESVNVSTCSIVAADGTIVWEKEQLTSIEYLTNDKELRIRFANPSVPNNKCKFVFTIDYLDMFGKEYSLTATGLFGDTIGLPRFKLATSEPLSL